MTIYFKKWKSPVCDLYFYADDDALLVLAFEETHEKLAAKLPTREFSHARSAVIERTIEQLKEYFAGARTEFDVPLAPAGTDFQRSVWNVLARIPYGKTLSYAEQAKELHSPKAVRAVGSANGRNPISIVVPCHRVITSTGKVSGYAGGPAVKRKLLALEGLDCP